MPKRDRPNDIELKVEDRVQRGDENAFNTDDQQEAAHILQDHWPTQFTELADQYNFTDGFYRQVINRYFGPVDDDITFSEIWEEYGTYDQYLQRRETDGASDAYERGYDAGYDNGFDAGYEKGYERGYADGQNDTE